jgi:hypothetical protein
MIHIGEPGAFCSVAQPLNSAPSPLKGEATFADLGDMLSG